MAKTWAGAMVLLALAWTAAAVSAQGGGGQGGGFVAYPQRRPGDPAAIERGKGTFGANCVFCHGADARGGDGGGPNLLRSPLVLDDQKGELIGPVVKGGRPGMPAFQLSDAQLVDIAEYLHSFPVSSRSAPMTIDILVGNAQRGKEFVAARCASCHAEPALRTFAGKIQDAKMLQQMWLMPGNTGGRAGGASPIAAPPVTVTVKLPDGRQYKGRLSRVDDFSVSLTEADGTYRTFRTTGTAITVDIQDPLQPHKDLLKVYTDADIHNVTAYIASLRAQ